MQVKKLGTISKMKHELKYDMFYKRSVIEQEICFAKYYKYKAAINSVGVRCLRFHCTTPHAPDLQKIACFCG